jgi:hypothetical protein
VVSFRLVVPFASTTVAALLLPLACASAPEAHAPRVGSGGVTILLAKGWHALPVVAPAPSMHVGDPVTRIVVASAPIERGRGCNDVDYSFSTTAVALVVLEWVRPTPGRLPPRPRHFTSKNLTIRTPPAIECFKGSGGSIAFAEQGRRFDAFVLLGRRASPRLADRARAVLGTLRVRKR